MGGSRREDGANAVEFALILPILLVLLFGLIYGGLVLNEQQQISHAAREASRFAATYSEFPFPQSQAFNATASRASATSQGVTHRANATMCVMYLAEGSSAPVRTWYDLDNPTTPIAPRPASECPAQIHTSGTPSGGPWVQVSIRMPTQIQAIFVTMTPTLGADAVSIVEEA